MYSLLIAPDGNISVLTLCEYKKALMNHLQIQTFEKLPDSSSTRVVIEHTLSVFPWNIARRLRHFADDTFQLNRAAGFVKFIRCC